MPENRTVRARELRYERVSAQLPGGCRERVRERDETPGLRPQPYCEANWLSSPDVPVYEVATCAL